jgi:hypothetical protein
VKVVVKLAPTGAEVGLEDADIFDDLRVVVEGETGSSDEALARALERYGVLDAAGEHAFLEADALPRLAGDLAAEPGWRLGYEAMLAFAGSHDWIDDQGRVQAHVERLSRPVDPGR